MGNVVWDKGVILGVLVLCICVCGASEVVRTVLAIEGEANLSKQSPCGHLTFASKAVKCCSVDQYDAVGNGRDDDTIAVQRAMDECTAAGRETNTNETSAVILFPKGSYKVGMISLGLDPNNIHIHIASDAVLIRGGDWKTWPPGIPEHVRRSLDNGRVDQARHVRIRRVWQDIADTDAIEDIESSLPGEHTGWITWTGGENMTWSGSGTIDGQGKEWWDLEASGQLCTKRPHMFAFTDTRFLTMTGLTLLNSPRFHLRFTSVRWALFDSLHIEAPSPSPNTDGIDPTGSRDIVIQNCFIGVDDDNVAIKAGFRPSYYPPGQALSSDVDWGMDQSMCTHSILIQNCIFTTGHGASIGSVERGCVRNITFRGIHFDGTTNGARIKTYDHAQRRSYPRHYWVNGKEMDTLPDGVSEEEGEGMAMDMVAEVRGITFEDLTLHRVKWPLIITQEYHGNVKDIIVPLQCMTPTPTPTPATLPTPTPAPVPHDSPTPPTQYVLVRDITYRNIKGNGGTDYAKLLCNDSPGPPCYDVEIDNVHVTWTSNKLAKCDRVRGSGIEEFCDRTLDQVAEYKYFRGIALLSLRFVALYILGGVLFLAFFTHAVVAIRRRAAGSEGGAGETNQTQSSSFLMLDDNDNVHTAEIWSDQVDSTAGTTKRFNDLLS